MRTARFQSRRRHDAGGFTLLELLLATAIAAIVLLVINATFFGALRLHNTTHEKIDDDLVVQRALAIMRRDFAGIMLPPSPTSTTTHFAGQLMTDVTSTNDLDGNSERITPDISTTSATIDGWSPFSEVQTVSYYLSPSTDGAPTKNLVRVVTRNLLPASDPTTEDQTLLTGVISAAISYFDGQDWQDVWDTTATQTLPVAIKFSLVRAPRGDTDVRRDTAPIELVVPVLVKTTTTAQADAAATTTGQ